MHSHDHDLIAALAEGILAGELASAAEAEITACPECAPELAAQRRALQALGGLPPAGLTLAEATRLRDAVAGALGVADFPVPRTVKRSRRSPWPAIAIAAGLAGIITIVPVMGLITNGSDDAGPAETVTAALEGYDDTNSTLRDASGGAPLETSEMVATTAAVAEESFVAGAQAPTTEAAATTTVAPMLGEDLEAFGVTADGQAAIRYLFETGTADKYAESAGQTDRTALDCSAEAEQTFGNAYLHVATPANLDDGRPVILYAAADWSAMVAFDPTDCSPVLTLP